MSFVAEAERTIDAPAARVFDRLADVASWPSWMPRSFALVVHGRRPYPSPLKLGDRVKVKVNGAPIASTLRVSRLERPHELAWRGGVRGLLWAEHRFVVEATGDRRTRVRSIETWHGALAGLLRRIVEPAALRVGGAQLEGLAKASAIARDAN
jgi:hypothetical protein